MDTIANILSTLVNAQAVHKKRVRLPYSRVGFEILKILEKNGYVNGVEEVTLRNGVGKGIRVQLKYVNKIPAIQGARRVSRPGLRFYQKAHDIKAGKDLGISIISTFAGILTDAEARKQNVGGEIMCRVW